jgi:hypothetical protein
VAAGCQASIPAVDDELSLDTCGGAVSLEFGGAGLDVEASCPDAHRVSISAPAAEVDPVYVFLRID